MNKKKKEPEETVIKEVGVEEVIETIAPEESEETPTVQPELLVSPEPLEALFRADPEKNRNRR